MRKLLRFFSKKIKSDRGDSIAEVLIALLISAVALVMLASMISSSTSMIDSSKKKIAEYYVPSDGSISNVSGIVQLVPVSGTVNISFPVQYSVNNTINNHPVVTFEKSNP